MIPKVSKEKKYIYKAHECLRFKSVISSSFVLKGFNIDLGKIEVLYNGLIRILL